MQGLGIYSTYLSGQNILATIFTMKSVRKHRKILKTQETDRPWTDRTLQYASKEEFIK